MLRTSKQTCDALTQTNTYTLLCIYALILFHWRGRAACCTHTHKARWRGDRKFAHKLRFSDKQLMLLWTIPSQKHNTNATLEAKHRNQLITVVCNLVGGMKVNVRGLVSRMAQVDGRIFENFAFHGFMLKYQLWTKHLKDPVTLTTKCYKHVDKYRQHMFNFQIMKKRRMQIK